MCFDKIQKYNALIGLMVQREWKKLFKTRTNINFKRESFSKKSNSKETKTVADRF